MPAYKYKTAEGHERHLQYRREYYKANRDRIRQRDNESARRNRKKKPEQYAEYMTRFLKKAKAAGPLKLSDNPDVKDILAEIAREEGLCGR